MEFTMPLDYNNFKGENGIVTINILTSCSFSKTVSMDIELLLVSNTTVYFVRVVDEEQSFSTFKDALEYFNYMHDV